MACLNSSVRAGADGAQQVLMRVDGHGPPSLAVVHRWRSEETMRTMVELKTSREIALLREAGRVAAAGLALPGTLTVRSYASG
jgi:hypothetical protein